MQIAIHPRSSEHIDTHAMLQYKNVAKVEKAQLTAYIDLPLGCCVAYSRYKNEKYRRKEHLHMVGVLQYQQCLTPLARLGSTNQQLALIQRNKHHNKETIAWGYAGHNA